MKLLFITTLSHTPWGGSEELWIKTVFEVLKNKVRVDILAYKWKSTHPKLTALKSDGANLYFRKTNYYPNNLFFRILQRIFGKVNSKRQLQFLFFKRKPDCIVISQGGTFDLGYYNQDLLVHYLLKANIPFLIICHNNADVGYVPEENVRETIYHVFEKAKEVLFVSQRNLHVAKRQLHRNIKNSSIISNTVNLNEVQIQKWNDTKTTYFAEVAALNCSHKGQDFLFEILSSDKWKQRDWVLNLYGKGEDADYLKKLAAFYQIENRVVFHGHTNDITKVWQQNHILLLPSLGEGMPLALQEAMLCGRCAVVTDVAGNPELIIEDKTGFLAGAPTVKLFDKALEKAWENKSEWKQLGENAYHFAKEKIDFTPEITLFNKTKKYL